MILFYFVQTSKNQVIWIVFWEKRGCYNDDFFSFPVLSTMIQTGKNLQANITELTPFTFLFSLFLVHFEFLGKWWLFFLFVVVTKIVLSSILMKTQFNNQFCFRTNCVELQIWSLQNYLQRQSSEDRFLESMKSFKALACVCDGKEWSHSFSDSSKQILFENLFFFCCKKR